MVKYKGNKKKKKKTYKYNKNNYHFKKDMIIKDSNKILRNDLGVKYQKTIVIIVVLCVAVFCIFFLAINVKADGTWSDYFYDESKIEKKVHGLKLIQAGEI